MPQFSANLGFLWPDFSLADAIRSAKSAGFHAVECHFPYSEPIDNQQSLDETGFTMLGLNTIRGPFNAGMAALQIQSLRRGQQSIKRFTTVLKFSTPVHVMAGKSAVRVPKKYIWIISNMRQISQQKNNMSVLIEPLNPFDMPIFSEGYGPRLRTTRTLNLANEVNVRYLPRGADRGPSG